MWNYPASKAWKWLMLTGAVSIIISLDPISTYKWEPRYYLTVAGLIEIGAGCAMFAYHIRKCEEDVTTKKKIILISVAVTIPVAIWGIVTTLNIL